MKYEIILRIQYRGDYEKYDKYRCVVEPEREEIVTMKYLAKAKEIESKDIYKGVWVLVNELNDDGSFNRSIL